MEIQRIQVLAYNFKANGIIEKGYGLIKNAFSKMEGKWIVNFSVVLFADWITINVFTSYMPFYLVYRRKLILLVETCYLIWKSLFIKEIENRNKLIQLWVTQFQLKQNHLNKAYLQKTRQKQEGKEAFNLSYNIRYRPLKVKNLILRHNALKKVNKSSNKTLNFW